jgi:nitrogen-specific signal transduction histidine kinase
VEVKRQTKDGKEIVTSMTISPLRDAEGRIVGASRICKDITHLKKAEERLILAERLSSLGELTAGVAHELRNPLAGIKTTAQALSEEMSKDDSRREYLNRITKEIDRLNDLLKTFFLLPQNLNLAHCHAISRILSMKSFHF